MELQIGQDSLCDTKTMKSLTRHALAEEIPDWGVLVLESHHSDDFTMEWREHDFYKLIYVLRGRGVIELDQRVVHFQEGDLVSVPPSRRNRITDAPDAASSLYVCCIARELLDFDAGLLEKLPEGKTSPSSFLSTRVASALRKMRHQQSSQSPIRSLSIVASAMRLLEWIIQTQTQSAKPRRLGDEPVSEEQVMRDYVARLATEFYEVTTIDDAANSIGLSRRTFTKLFQNETGSTWLTYVRRLAVNHAKHQLAQTSMSIASVAFEAGFNDLSTFYRQFKAQVGTSPKQYRETLSITPE